MYPESCLQGIYPPEMIGYKLPNMFTVVLARILKPWSRGQIGKAIGRDLNKLVIL